MREAVLTAAFFAGWALLWIAYGLLKAIRDLFAERAAAWLLPPAQPVTFRVALLVAFAARAIAPNRVASFDPPRIFFAFFPVTWTSRPWPDPDAAIAELQVDLRCERRVLSPLRLVLPLLGSALLMRAGNLWRLAIGIACLPLMIVVVPLILIPATLMEEIDWLDAFGERVESRFESIRYWVAARRQRATKGPRVRP